MPNSNSFFPIAESLMFLPLQLFLYIYLEKLSCGLINSMILFCGIIVSKYKKKLSFLFNPTLDPNKAPNGIDFYPL